MLLLPLLLVILIEPGTKHLERDILIHELAAFILALDNDARRIMSDPDSAVGLVDMLATGTSRAIGIKTVVLWLELYLDIIIDFRGCID